MKLYLLGPPRLEHKEKLLHLGRRKALALLAYLAVTERSHSRDVLSTLLWSEFDQQSARAELRRNLSVVNKVLGGNQVLADREMVGLDPQSGLWVDVIEFRRHIAAVEKHHHPPDTPCPDCMRQLTEAIAFYRDDFMHGFTLPDSPLYDEWQRYQTEKLKDELVVALSQLTDWQIALKEYDAATTHVRRWLELDPLNERSHRQMMRVLALNGQRSAALVQFEACRRLLAEELGVEPGEETTRFYEQIHDEELETVSTIERKETPRRHNLPPQLTPFIGRQAMLSEIREQLNDDAYRLLTLIGPGGSGKTRLALQVASSFVSDETASSKFPDGVYFVPLAHLRSSDAIAPAIIQALDISTSPRGTPRDQILDYLRRKKMLLILDNYEHLLVHPESDGTASRQEEGGDVEVINAILATASAVKLLVTSRAALNVEGERLHTIGGMDLPPLPSPLPFTPTEPVSSQEQPKDISTYSAVRLFTAAAQRVHPAFRLSADNLVHVVRICHLADGLPLAILLAAGWIRILSPADIVEEVQRRYDFLQTQLRGVPERQRGVRATFDYSWDLLSERERSVLAGFSVFKGGCTLEAAKQVTDASMHDLMALVDQSLLQRAAGGRYELHELLRQFAAEKLALSPSDEALARDRHCAFYTTAFQRWHLDIESLKQKTSWREMASDLANALAAWDWAVERRYIDQLNRAAEALAFFYTHFAWTSLMEAWFQSAMDLIIELEAQSPGTSVERLRLWTKFLAWQGFSWRYLGYAKKAFQSVQHSLELLEHPALTGQDIRLEKAIALTAKGDVLFYTVDREAAREPWQRSLALWRELKHYLKIADMLNALGGLSRTTGSLEKAEQLYREAQDIYVESGIHWDIAMNLTFLGIVLMQQGLNEEAEYLQQEAITLSEEIGDWWIFEGARRHLALTLICSGKYAESQTLLETCVGMCEEIGKPTFLLGHANTKLAHAQLHLGQYKDARQRGSEGLTYSRQANDAWGAGFALLVLGRAALSQGITAEAKTMLQESVNLLCNSKNWDFAYWALPSLAHVELTLGQIGKAKENLGKMLKPALAQGHGFALMSVIPVMALLEVKKRHAEKAVELYALASRYGHVANSRWWEDVVGKQIATVASTLPPDVVAATQERGRARNLEETVSELLDEMVA